MHPTIEPLPPATWCADLADLGQALDAFTRLRPRLLAIAQRILGSRSEAEDVVQEAWLRWQTCDRGAVRHPTAFLVTTATRLALNVAQSARMQREAPFAADSPEQPDPAPDPADVVEHREAVEAAVRVLLMRLGPVERTAFVLRHAFDYPYERIADLVHTSEVNARQVVSRAGKHLTHARLRVATRAPVGSLAS